MKPLKAMMVSFVSVIAKFSIFNTFPIWITKFENSFHDYRKENQEFNFVFHPTMARGSRKVLSV